jgi:glucose-6-phosphate 1-dehydrogenase
MLNESKLLSVELVTFGAAGDLPYRMQMPALYNLFLDGLMPEIFTIFDEPYDSDHILPSVFHEQPKKGG